MDSGEKDVFATRRRPLGAQDIPPIEIPSAPRLPVTSTPSWGIPCTRSPPAPPPPPPLPLPQPSSSGTGRIENPYEVYELRTPSERACAVVQARLVRQPEYSSTANKYRRIPDSTPLPFDAPGRGCDCPCDEDHDPASSVYPRPFSMPSRASLLDCLTDDDSALSVLHQQVPECSGDTLADRVRRHSEASTSRSTISGAPLMTGLASLDVSDVVPGCGPVAALPRASIEFCDPLLDLNACQHEVEPGFGSLTDLRSVATEEGAFRRGRKGKHQQADIPRSKSTGCFSSRRGGRNRYELPSVASLDLPPPMFLSADQVPTSSVGTSAPPHSLQSLGPSYDECGPGSIEYCVDGADGESPDAPELRSLGPVKMSSIGTSCSTPTLTGSGIAGPTPTSSMTRTLSDATQCNAPQQRTGSSTGEPEGTESGLSGRAGSSKERSFNCAPTCLPMRTTARRPRTQMSIGRSKSSVYTSGDASLAQRPTKTKTRGASVGSITGSSFRNSKARGRLMARLPQIRNVHVVVSETPVRQLPPAEHEHKVSSAYPGRAYATCPHLATPTCMETYAAHEYSEEYGKANDEVGYYSMPSASTGFRLTQEKPNGARESLDGPGRDCNVESALSIDGRVASLGDPLHSDNRNAVSKLSGVFAWFGARTG